jgi:hypothetical protein
MRQLLKRINFPKVFITLAVTLVVAFGACGVTVLASIGKREGDALLPLAIIETVAVVVSAAGLFFTFVLWVIASIMGVHKVDPAGTARLFDSADRNDDAP